MCWLEEVDGEVRACECSAVQCNAVQTVGRFGGSEKERVEVEGWVETCGNLWKASSCPQGVARAMLCTVLHSM